MPPQAKTNGMKPAIDQLLTVSKEMDTDDLQKVSPKRGRLRLQPLLHAYLEIIVSTHRDAIPSEGLLEMPHKGRGILARGP